MRIILSGTIGASGLGGQAWAVLQYLLGLRALGHDVYYLEDCRSSYVYVWEEGYWTHELEYPAAHINACLAPFGFGDRWIYREAGRSLGMPLNQFLEICRTADLLIMRAVPIWIWRDEYDRPRCRAFIDVDPGFTQITLAGGDEGWVQGVGKAERRFTLAQRLGATDCPIPDACGPWIKTHSPVFLPEWPMAESDTLPFTSILRWQGFREVTWNGVAYGQRDAEFPRYANLPALTTQRLQIAQMGADPAWLAQHGWDVVPGEVISRMPADYHRFIQQSRAELSIPKNGYVKMRGGWFSDRSVCYLASGRPVLIEDTGLSDWLPIGDGVVTFNDPDSAAAGIDRINAGYAHHRRSARRLAEDIFSTAKVLPELLEACFSPQSSTLNPSLS